MPPFLGSEANGADGANEAHETNGANGSNETNEADGANGSKRCAKIV